MAKQMGNGFPLAAVATTKEIADKFKALGKLTFTTYGGNPIAMAAGRAVLKVLEEEKLQENCHEMGKIFKKGMLEIQDRYEQIGDVRGEGLMVGIEIVKNRESKVPDPELFAKVYEKTKENGILLGKGGRYGAVFRF